MHRSRLTSRAQLVAVTTTAAMAVVGALAVGSTAGAAPPADADVAFPQAVEPAPEEIPEQGVGAPDKTALDAPVKADGPAAQAPAQAVDDGPLTGFEQRGGADWTTLEEERQFLRQVDQGSDRMSLGRIGTTLQGRPIWMAQLGAEPRTPEQVAAGSTILFACSQHGNEPAGRESCLQLIRDLAYDDTPATGRLLQRTTVLVVPTANPDGRAADTRGNSQGIDVNRDHLVLETNEGQALARVLRDYRPQVVLDAHEYGGRPDVYDRDLIRLWPRNLNVDEDVRAVAQSLARDYIDPTVQYEGYTTGDYGIWYGPDGRPIAQVAGNEDERIMRNMMGLKHKVGQLTESRVNDFDDDETETENKIRRVRTHVLANQATLDLMLEQGAQILATTREAAQQAVEEGASGELPFFFAGADNMLPSPSAVDLDPPCAYELTVEQLREVRRTMNLHGIEFTREGRTVTVSMAQERQPIIPLLLDERANFNLVDAVPVECG
ncbi:M14 family metallopeptidase [Thalassiella azotivora]